MASSTTTTAATTPWVLSIQSHVAFGHVGNAAAVFTLQRQGVEVINIHTVQFSNHTGYGVVKGQIFSAEHIRDVLQGIKDRGALGRCQAILSGYLGDATIGQAVLDAVAEVRELNPDADYLCDPVMGDVGRGIYVQPAIPDVMREQVLPAASIITPNRFEFELLTQQEVTSLDDAIEQARALIARLPKLRCVVITSLDSADIPADQLYTIAVTADQAWYVASPKLPVDPLPTGLGDTFSAVMLGRLVQGDDLPEALSHAVSTLSALLSRTENGQRDLPLIAAQDMIVSPAPRYSAVAI
ncbi:pyridoxal kinase PdxY [Zymobacter sp. IVIA_5232.4 C2]|uniref:pyridoxal kinase PdxY n=1 Tax=Zymobacter sp. IVIA_5232.4 C2 TaxID=3394855 RepID=UPI0039C375D7